MMGEKMRLKGKVALITGAASGIGLAIAQRFLQEGAQVVAGDIAPDMAAASTTLCPLMLDVRSEADWQTGLARTEAVFGKLDILVNNAGLGVSKALVDLSLDEWRQVTGVNLDGVFLGMKYAIPAMVRAGGG